MDYDLTPNHRFRVRLEHVGREGQPVLVVDDFLRDPESAIRYAAEEACFSPATSAYPGIRAATPPAYRNALARGLGRFVGNL